MPTNIYTQVTIGEDVYSIKKFDAKTGLKLARLVISKAAPLIPMLESLSGDNGENKSMDDNAVYDAVSAVLDTLSDNDIDNLVDKCLRVCYANLSAGLAPIIDDTGNYGVEGVEYDMSLTLRLCFEAIKWGASDFFDGKNSGLKQLFNLVGSSQNQ